MASRVKNQSIEKFQLDSNCNGPSSQRISYKVPSSFKRFSKRKLSTNDPSEPESEDSHSVQVKNELNSNGNQTFCQLLEKSKQQFELKKETFSEQEFECGFHADRYEAASYFTSLSLQQKEVHRTKVVNHIPKSHLEKIWPNTEIYSNQNVENLRIKLKNSSVWLILKFPNEPSDKAFKYIGAIVTNNLYEGLLHSYVRHWNQWEKFIPQLRAIWNKLGSKIQNQLKGIKKALGKKTCEIKIAKLLEKLKNETSPDVGCALIDAQLAVFEFIKRNIENYLYEGVDLSEQIKTHFEIPNSDEDTHVMVLSVSSNLYTSNANELRRERNPIRKVTTAYFISKEEYLNQRFYADYESDDEEEDGKDYSYQEKRDAMKRHGTLSSDQPDYKNNLSHKFKKVSNEEITKRTDSENRQHENNSESEGDDDADQALNATSLYYQHVRMPSNFAYTCAILTNDFSKGLLHTFARHWDQFQDHIESFKDLRYERLLVITNELQDIHDAKKSKEKNDAYKNAKAKIISHDDRTINVIRLGLLKAQSDLLTYIQDNVTFRNYRGEGLYTLSLVQVYFKTQRVTDCLKAVCVDCLFYPTKSDMELDSDAKFIKTINTVFYTNEHGKYYVGKTWTRITQN